MTAFLIWHSESLLLILQLLFKNAAIGSVFIGFYMLAKYPKTKLFFRKKLSFLSILGMIIFFALVFFDTQQVFFSADMALILQQQSLAHIGAYALIFYMLFNVMLLIAFKKDCESCPKLRFSGIVIALVAASFTAIFSPYYQDFDKLQNIFLFTLPFVVELCHVVSLAGIYFIISSTQWLNKKERLNIALITFTSSFIIALAFLQHNIILLLEFNQMTKLFIAVLSPLLLAFILLGVFYKTNSTKGLNLLALLVLISLLALRSFEFASL